MDPTPNPTPTPPPEQPQVTVPTEQIPQPAVEQLPATPETPPVPSPPPVVPSTPSPVTPIPAAPPPAEPPAPPASLPPPANTNPALADDVDVIEKEWVDQAEKVIKQTAGDPHAEEDAVEDLQIDYLKKRYGKDVKKSE